MEELVSNEELAERALQGDTEAFGRLIHVHRDMALRWAESMTRDPFLSEDIVQDASIQAFLKLHSLTDPSRFSPWLRKIVTNQVRMRMRRGGPHKREQPFSSWQPLETTRNVDSDMAAHLSTKMSALLVNGEDPVKKLLLKEFNNNIDKYMRCLNKRERAVFEAHFLWQLTPEEIADDLKTTINTVYTYLYRSRKKLHNLYGHMGIDKLVDGTAWLRPLSKRILRLPIWDQGKLVKATLVDRAAHMLLYIENPVSPSKLMGDSGFAFRMKIPDKAMFADGIYMFDWHEQLTKLFLGVGYDVEIICGQLSRCPVPLEGAVERFPIVSADEDSFMPFIRTAIRSNKPILYFDTNAEAPYIHEWSLIYGYDDEKRVCYLTDAMYPSGKTRSYEEMTRSSVRFMAIISGRSAVIPSPDDMIKEALRFAVSYAKDGCSYRPLTPYFSYTSGLSAYSKWIEQLRDPVVIPNRYGTGQNAMVYADSRRHATSYLRSLVAKGGNLGALAPSVEAYSRVSEELDSLCRLLPFGACEPSMTLEIRKQCAVHLSIALEMEEQGIRHIEIVLKLITEGESFDATNGRER